MDLKIYWCAIKPEDQLVFGLLPNGEGVHIYLMMIPGKTSRIKNLSL